MPELKTPYLHISSALTPQDVECLKDACKRHVLGSGMPCYALINDLSSPTFTKIKRILERALEEPLHYLNDFYLYTDSSFKTSWHIDTELFAFERAVNAWILLSPAAVEDPLGFIDQLNDAPERTYHSVRIEGAQCVFGDYFSGKSFVKPLAEVENERVHTPRIQVGDILVINPKRFHKTNVESPKHAIAFKFIMRGHSGFLSSNQVDAYLWPEVGVFNDLVRRARAWDEVIEGIRRTLMSAEGREKLSSGFYPDQFELYKRMVVSL